MSVIKLISGMPSTEEILKKWGVYKKDYHSATFSRFEIAMEEYANLKVEASRNKKKKKL